MSVVMAKELPMLAGHTIVIAWCGAMGEALQVVASHPEIVANKDCVFKLFEVALSVPIRLRLCPDEDQCQLASLQFSETLYTSSAASGGDSIWIFAEHV